VKVGKALGAALLCHLLEAGLIVLQLLCKVGSLFLCVMKVVVVMVQQKTEQVVSTSAQNARRPVCDTTKRDGEKVKVELYIQVGKIVVALCDIARDLRLDAIQRRHKKHAA